MTIHVIGVGATAQHWDGVGYSIGCNDCERWGAPVTELILVNRPEKFLPERLAVITQSDAKVFSHKPVDWMGYFGNVHQLPLSPFVGRVRRGIIYKSATSTFIAISKAFVNGATEIVIWGVDFLDHKFLRPESAMLKGELLQYKKLIEGIESYGVKVYLGADGSALESFVPIKYQECGYCGKNVDISIHAISKTDEFDGDELSTMEGWSCENCAWFNFK